MSEPTSYSGEAFNQVPDSENRIHSDEIARQHGFEGGLVPGVTVSAYLLHPAAVAWGEDFLDRGSAHVVVSRPLYDRRRFDVHVARGAGRSYDAELVDATGVRCATAEVALPDTPRMPPRARRGAPLADGDRVAATPEGLEALRDRGMKALRVAWTSDAQLGTYFRAAADMPRAFAPGDAAYGNPAFLLGTTNWLLAANVALGPWLHLETDSQWFARVPQGTALDVEGEISALFERKGHHFVDVLVGVFLPGGEPAATVRMRCIYRLRGA